MLEFWNRVKYWLYRAGAGVVALLALALWTRRRQTTTASKATEALSKSTSVAQQIQTLEAQDIALAHELRKRDSAVADAKRTVEGMTHEELLQYLDRRGITTRDDPDKR